MENKARATAAGAFVVVMILMVVGTVLWFSQDRTVRVTYDIVTARSVEGIVSRAPVELYGVNVGIVEDVSFMAQQPGYVRIRLSVDKDAPINRATYATLSSRGVTGSVFVNLLDDSEASLEARQQMLAASSGEPLQIPLRAGAFESFTESAQAVLQRADQTLGSLNVWLSQENSERLFAAVDNLGHAANDIAGLSRTLDSKVGGVLDDVGRVVNTANSTFAEIRTLARNGNEAVAALTAPGGTIESMGQGTQALAQAAEHLSDMTLVKVDEATHTVNQTVRTAQRFLRGLEAQPQSLLWGRHEGVPGPGERGYMSPYSAQGVSQ